MSKPDCTKTIREFIDTSRWEGEKATENFAYLCERLVGRPGIQQLAFNNGCYVSGILEFMEDNPGLVQAMVEWVEENYESEIEEKEEEEEADADDPEWLGVSLRKQSGDGS